jgi:uncharacterized repeat protein (TIGR03803 family)
MGFIRLAIVISAACLVALVQGCGGGGSGGGDTTAPTVIATQPAAHAAGVRLSPPITATFSKDIHPLSIRRDTFFVDGATGKVTYDRKHRRAIFKPDVNLAPDQRYTAHITNGVFDLQGRRISASIAWEFTTGDTAKIIALLSFDGANTGADPKGSLTLVDVAPSAGATPVPMLFGRTSTGGANGGGTIFSIPAASSSAAPAVFAFIDHNGCQPHHDSMTLLSAPPSPGASPTPTLFGAALFTSKCSSSGSGNGALFSIDPVQFAQGNPDSAYTILHSFGGSPSDGANSHSCLGISSNKQTLYGTTAEGGENTGGAACGASGCGTVYSYNPFATLSPKYQVLYSFQSGVTAAASPTPASTLVSCPAPTSAGTSTTPVPTATATPLPPVVLACSTCTGAIPHGRLVAINNGVQDVLLGIARQGGLNTNGNKSGNGVIYALLPAASATPASFVPLHYFIGAPDDGAFTDHGNLAVGQVMPASGGSPAQASVYGMTTQGGSGAANDQNAGPTTGSGVIFSALVNLPQSGAPSVAQYLIMHDFAPCSTSGSNPANVPDLVNGGLVPDGYNPFGSLLYANAMLYGMTRNGGKHGGGVIFIMNPDPGCAGQLSAECYGILASFDTPKNTLTSKGNCHCTAADSPSDSCDPNGSAPIDNLIASADGATLYGMTQSGGASDLCNANSYGTVFSILATP